MSEDPNRAGQGERERYAPGYSAAVVGVMQRRTLASCAPFVMPYLERGMNVLDSGCGAGSMTLELAALVAPGQVVGLDLESRVLEQAQALAEAQGIDNVRFEQGDSYAVPYSDGTFDVVFSHSLITHLTEPMRALREMRRVLKPSGLAVVIDNDPGTYVVCPNGSAMERFWDLFIRRQQYNGGLRLLPRHLRAALLEAGFAVAEAHAGSEAFGAPQQVAEAAAGQLSSVEFSQIAVEQGWATQQEMADLPQGLLAWGERPDAFTAVLKCGAVGWVAR